MNLMLRKYGIEFCCLERCKYGSEYISATKVRSLIKDGKLDEIKNYVPESTIEIIKNMYYNT